MAYEISTATGHVGFLKAIRRFLLGFGIAGTPGYAGTGNGTITGVQPLGAAVTETWTIACTTAATNGGTFSVTGSVSGAKANATVGTPYDNGLIQFTLNDGATDFIVTDAFTVAVTQGALSIQRAIGFSGTGNGTMTPASIYPGFQFEVWTIKCTATATNGGTFSVTGSVSGAQASATVGTHYDNGKVKFTINDGSTDFALNDSFVLTSPVWFENRWVETSGEWEFQVKAPGLGGTTESYFGIRSYSLPSSDYYNIALMACSGYVPGNAWSAQPGKWPAGTADLGCSLWNGSIPYWIRANGQAFSFAAHVNLAYMSGGFGRLISYHTPGQYPYPAMVWSMLSSASSANYSSGSNDFGIRGGLGQFGLRKLDGTWINPNTYPYQTSYAIRGSGPDVFDHYIPEPIVVHDATNLYGEIDGLYFCPVFGGNAAEDTIVIGGVTYVMISNFNRTGNKDMFVMRLD